MSELDEKLWTMEDVAKYCRVKTSVVKYWLQNTTMPYIKLGKHHRFDPQDIKAWVEKQKRGSISGISEIQLKRITRC